MSRSVRVCVSLAGAVGVVMLSCAQSASASLYQPAVTSDTPSTQTPHAVDGDGVANAAVHTFSQAGSVMYAGGDFHLVQDPAQATTYVRSNLFSFDIATGVPTEWYPKVNGEVFRTFYQDPYLYVGGSFSLADGVSGSLVRYRVDSGTPVIDADWHPAVYGPVSDLDYTHDKLIVAGSFPQRLVALNPDTGRNTHYIDLGISGSVKRYGAGPTEVYRFAISPDGSRLLAIGNFTSVAGAVRYRAFMVNLGATSTTLAEWYYTPLMNRCRDLNVRANLRDVDFSPDGTYFVLVASGYIPTTTDGIGRDICDAAARFETTTPSPDRPTWINYTGGDTLHSVAVTGKAVYVGGHERWLDNPYGANSAGLGAVPSRGVGAIDPETGLAMNWNPTKTRGVGLKFIYPTTDGIWYGSDGRMFAGQVHDSIAFTPTP